MELVYPPDLTKSLPTSSRRSAKSLDERGTRIIPNYPDTPTYQQGRRERAGWLRRLSAPVGDDMAPEHAKIAHAIARTDANVRRAINYLKM